MKNSIEKIILKLLYIRPFFGIMLQNVDIIYTEKIPTIGVKLNNKKRFSIYINQDFLNNLTLEEACATFIHELHHILYKHVFYSPKENIKRWNIAMDISINQKIESLPKNAIFIENFKDKNGNPFPLNLTTEEYYNLLENSTYQSENGISKTLDEIEEYDQHDWLIDINGDKLIKENLKNLVKTSLNKTNNLYGSKFNYSDFSLINSLYKELCKNEKIINTNKILSHTIQRTIQDSVRISTWLRPSKRYGYLSKGTKYRDTFKLHIYLDTSGSIDIKTLEKFVNLIKEITKKVNTKIKIFFFHTDIYYEQILKKNENINFDRFESGGTDLTDVLNNIKRNNVDLNIILTDGYYSDVNILTKKNILFIITKNINHSLKHIGKTIYYEDTLL